MFNNNNNLEIFLYFFDLKNMISTWTKDFCEKQMTLIHLRMSYK
jgi:hypothetical protein